MIQPFRSCKHLISILIFSFTTSFTNLNNSSFSFNNNNNTDNSFDNQQQLNTINWTNNVTPQWEQENNQETNNNTTTTTTNQLHLVEYSF